VPCAARVITVPVGRDRPDRERNHTLMASTPRTRIRTIALAVTIAVAATGLAVIAAAGASAATGCQVTYRLNQWTGGFVAYVGVSGGDAPLHGWTVTWTYGGDQRITSAWNATVTQTGSAVSATNLAYNGEVAANASTEFGVQGTVSTGTAPTVFAVNGVPCNGSSPSTTAPPTTVAPTTTPPPTSVPPTSVPPTSVPPTTLPPVACGSLLICDGFESQTGSTPSGAWSVVNPNCSGTGTAAIDTAIAHSGSRSLRVNGAEGYCNHVLVKSSTALTGTVWFARFYVRHTMALPTAHVTMVAMRDGNDGGRDLRMGGQNGRLQWNRESDDQTLPAQSPAGVALSAVLPTNTWSCVEFMVNGSNGQMQTWLNGTDVPGLREDGVPTADIDQQWLSRTFRPGLTDFRLGWESYGVGADVLWYDDVAVGASRIGC
jgi:polysaccharide lyase-like protein/cellulose binding protein with CBM2 domain